MEWMKRLTVALLALAVALGLVEAGLRLQQRLGPFYDLELNNISNIPSELLNHTHAAREDWHLGDASKYGKHTGYRYSNHYDRNGVRIDPLCERDDSQLPSLAILFLGDSFIEGYDLEHSVPRHVCSELRNSGKLRRSIRVLNAGMSSYSPSIYIVQAKLLIPALRPDFVVVAIDETDLGDDYLRYRALLRRDELARITAVRSTPANRDFTEGFLRIKQADYPLYLMRFAARFYHTQVRARTQRSRAEIQGLDPLVYAADSAPDAAQRYHVEITVFEARMEELAFTLSELMGGSDNLLLVYHPHLQHLRPVDNGRVWNTFVRDTIGKVAARHGIPFYDMTEDMHREMAGAAERYYWANDMHFNFEGLALYGRLLAARLEEQLREGGMHLDDASPRSRR